MARRKRLSPLAAPAAPSEEAEAVMNFSLGNLPGFSRPPVRPPVAQVAAEAATRAALDDLAAEMTAAREGGRLVVDLPLEAVEAEHLLRDRSHHDPEEMAALKASLAARGQQVPIEVVVLGAARLGRYGLISGARRLAALKALFQETGEARFSRVQALIRPATELSQAYLAMVEENEIRADLSFYERGRLVAEAARLGVFETPAQAAKGLFGNTTPARRSKILSFVALHQALGAALRFPEAVPEKVGLALVAAVQADATFAPRLAARLQAARPATPEAERALLDRALRPDPAPRDLRDLAPGLVLERAKGRAVLSGKAVTPELLQALEEWLRAR